MIPVPWFETRRQICDKYPRVNMCSPGPRRPHHFSALCNVGDRDTAGYETTDSAIVGGTTTIVDFAPQDPDRRRAQVIDSGSTRGQRN